MVPSRDGHPSSACCSYTLWVCAQQPSAAPLHGFTKAVPPPEVQEGLGWDIPLLSNGAQLWGTLDPRKSLLPEPFPPTGVTGLM